MEQMCFSLHNYLRLTENACYSPNCDIDSEDNSGVIKAGDWQTIVANYEGHFRSFQEQTGRYSYQANAVRTTPQYFRHPKGKFLGSGMIMSRAVTLKQPFKTVKLNWVFGNNLQLI